MQLISASAYCFGLLPLVLKLESDLVSDAPGNCLDELPDMPVEAPVDSEAFSFLAAGLVPASVLVDGFPPVEFALTSVSAASAGAVADNATNAAAAKIVFILRSSNSCCTPRTLPVDRAFPQYAVGISKFYESSGGPDGAVGTRTVVRRLPSDVCTSRALTSVNYARAQ